MRKGIVAFVVAGVVGYGVASVQSGDDKARQIVDKAVKAAGGEAVLKKHQTATFNDKGTYYGMGDGLPYTGKFAMQWPDKMRMEIEGIFIIMVDGSKGWMKMGDQNREMSKEEIDQHMLQNRAGWITTLVPLKDKAFSLSVVGDAKVDEKPAVAVRVSRKAYPDVSLFFDTKTGLLVKSEFRNKAAEQGYQEVTQETFYQNYRDEGGAKVPSKVVVKRDGKLYLESEASNIQLHDKLDPKLFAP